MSHPSHTAEDWIPRDDMALLIRSSVDTVKRDAKKHHLDTRTDGAGGVLVNVGDFLRLGRLRPEDLTVGATPAESAGMLRIRETVTTLTAQVAELTGRCPRANWSSRRCVSSCRFDSDRRLQSRPLNCGNAGQGPSSFAPNEADSGETRRSVLGRRTATLA